MKWLWHNHKHKQWQLFIAASKASLKGVLLHIGNEFPSVPIFHAIQMKESYDNMKLLLHSICYGLLEYLSSLDGHSSPCWHAAWFYQTLLLLCKWGRVTKEHQAWDTTTSNENIFTFNINQAWYDDEFCQSMDHDGKALITSFRILHNFAPTISLRRCNDQETVLKTIIGLFFWMTGKCVVALVNYQTY